MIAGALLTVGLMAAAFVLAPAQYEARALIVLLPPTTTVGEGGNPYTELGGLDTAAGVLSLAMNTEDVADALAATSATASFTVEEDESTSGPVLRLTIEDIDPQTTLAALETLVGETGPTLTRLQQDAGAPGDTWITASVVTSDASPSIVRQGQIRTVLGAGGLGVALTGLALVALERRSRARSARGTSSDTGNAATGAPPVPGGGATPADQPSAPPVVGTPSPQPKVPTPYPRAPDPSDRTTALPVAATMPIAALSRVGPVPPGLENGVDRWADGEVSPSGNGRGTNSRPG